MLSKTVIAAAALAASVAAYDLPSCWTSCFEQYEVDSEGCLCTDKLGSVVGSCIDAGCSAANATAYTSWLASYCNEAPVSSNTWAVPSSTYVIPSSVPTLPPVYSTPVESQPIPSYPAGSTPPASAPVPSETYPAGPASSTSSATISVCTESTTLIWRSSTAVVPVTISHYPGGAAPSGSVGGGWGTYPAGNGSVPATSTGAFAPGYSGPAATGAAAPFAKIGAGVAAVAGAAALIL